MPLINSDTVDQWTRSSYKASNRWNPKFHGNIVCGIDRNSTEAELRNIIEPKLQRYFHLSEREVTGFNEFHNKKMKIDLIIKPRFNWHFENIGVEFKRPSRLKTVDYGHWTRQCINYHLTDWGEFGKGIPILMCPGLDFVRYGGRPDFYDNDQDDFFHVLTRVMSAFGVGELVPTDSGGLMINFCRTHHLWTSWNGLSHDGRCWRFDRTGH